MPPDDPTQTPGGGQPPADQPMVDPNVGGGTPLPPQPAPAAPETPPAPAGSELPTPEPGTDPNNPGGGTPPVV